MRRKWSRLLGISLTSALAVSCASGADDAASQGSEDEDDIVAGQSEELGAAKSSAERLARVALRDTKISKAFGANVRQALAAGKGHDLIVKLNVPASLKGAERLAAIKSAQEKMRASFGTGLEIKQTLKQVPYALVHVQSEAALDQLLEHEGVSKLHEDAKLLPMTVGVKTPTETAAYVNQSSAASALGVAVSSLGSYDVAPPSCGLSVSNGGFETGDTSGWSATSTMMDVFSPAQEGSHSAWLNGSGSMLTQDLGVIDASIDTDVSIYVGEQNGFSLAGTLELHACSDAVTCVQVAGTSFGYTASGAPTPSDLVFTQQTVTATTSQLAGHDGETLRLIITGADNFALDNVSSCAATGPSVTKRVGVAVLDGAMDATEVDQNCTDINAGTNCRVASFANVSGGVDEVTDHAIVSGAVVHAMAPGANIHSIQVTSGGLASQSAVATALSNLLTDVQGGNADNIKVISLSYGSLDAFAVGSDACAGADTAGIGDLITQLRDAGVLVVAPSGNGANLKGVSFPACLDSAVSVASVTTFSGLDAVLDVTNSDDTDSPTCTITSNSVDKVLCNANSATGVSLLAPGFQLDADGASGPVTAQSGTSIAAAHVAGALAVMNAAFATDSTPESMDRALNRLTHSAASASRHNESARCASPGRALVATLRSARTRPSGNMNEEGTRSTSASVRSAHCTPEVAMESSVAASAP